MLLFHSFRNVCVVLELCEQIVNKLLRQGLGELADTEESDRGGDHTDNERRDPKRRTGNVPQQAEAKTGKNTTQPALVSFLQ